MEDLKSVSNKMRFDVLKRDGFTCQYCGRSAPAVVLEVDHKIPLCNGGKNTISNLITACINCNRGKGIYGLEEIPFEQPEYDLTPMMTVREVATKLGVSILTVRRWIDAGQIKHIRIGSTIRIDRKEIDRIKRGEVHE